MQHTHFIVGIEIQRDLKASLINLYIEDLISESFSLSPIQLIQRNCAIFLLKVKQVEVIADLKLLSKVVY